MCYILLEFVFQGEYNGAYHISNGLTFFGKWVCYILLEFVFQGEYNGAYHISNGLYNTVIFSKRLVYY